MSTRFEWQPRLALAWEHTLKTGVWKCQKHVSDGLRDFQDVYYYYYIHKLCDIVTHIYFHPAPSRPPTNISHEVQSPNDVLLTWNPPEFHHQNGIIRQYHISLRENATGREWELVTVRTNMLLDFLNPHSYYTYRVSAVTVGNGPYSDRRNFTTEDDGKQ